MSWQVLHGKSRRVAVLTGASGRYEASKSRVGHMTDYAFKVGQMVHYRTQLYSGVARGLYQVTQLMPAEDGEFKYRIKSPHDITSASPQRAR